MIHSSAALPEPSHAQPNAPTTESELSVAGLSGLDLSRAVGDLKYEELADILLERTKYYGRLDPLEWDILVRVFDEALVRGDPYGIGLFLEVVGEGVPDDDLFRVTEHQVFLFESALWVWVLDSQLGSYKLLSSPEDLSCFCPEWTASDLQPDGLTFCLANHAFWKKFEPKGHVHGIVPCFYTPELLWLCCVWIGRWIPHLNGVMQFS